MHIYIHTQEHASIMHKSFTSHTHIHTYIHTVYINHSLVIHTAANRHHTHMYMHAYIHTYTRACIIIHTAANRHHRSRNGAVYAPLPDSAGKAFGGKHIYWSKNSSEAGRFCYTFKARGNCSECHKVSDK